LCVCTDGKKANDGRQEVCGSLQSTHSQCRHAQSGQLKLLTVNVCLSYLQCPDCVQMSFIIRPIIMIVKRQDQRSISERRLKTTKHSPRTLSINVVVVEKKVVS